MQFGLRSAALAVAAFMLGAHAGTATMLPRFSFEDLTDRSDVIIAGDVAQSWVAWDANHKYIWTHYRIAVSSAHKGLPAKSVDIAEPGGIIGGLGMTIAGSVNYAPGEKVVVFVQRMPNGYLRTTGWGQGKYAVDSGGFLHADTALKAADLVDTKSQGETGTSLRSLNGMSLREFTTRVAARVTAVRSAGGAR